MKTLVGIFLFAIAGITLGMWYESTLDPYEEGIHWSYSIVCENGFIYKVMDNRRGAIQIFNSDGTPLKCGEKIY